MLISQTACPVSTPASTAALTITRGSDPDVTPPNKHTSDLIDRQVTCREVRTYVGTRRPVHRGVVMWRFDASRDCGSPAANSAPADTKLDLYPLGMIYA